jgi:hypothetical protein
MFSFSAQGQEDTLSSNMELTTISRINLGSSYITFPTDLGNIEPLWFEGNIIPNFMIRKSNDSRIIGVLTPQIIIRMYQEESFPVRTPSYIPKITVYYRLIDFPGDIQHTLFARIAHHSNGQEGEFYLPDGEINLKYGSFATNFVEFGFIHNHINHKLKAYQFFSSSFEIHPPGWSIDELKGKYSMFRWHNEFSINRIPIGKLILNNRHARISLKAKAMWMFGNINNWQNFDLDRLNVSLTIYFHSLFLEDIGFFLQMYSGMDYYNIYFNQQRQIIRFGIMTDILKF